MFDRLPSKTNPFSKFMTGSYHDPNWTEKVTIPVKRVGDRWEFFYGGDVPVKEHALGELTIDTASIKDGPFRDRVTQEALVCILDEGTTLRITLSDRECPIYKHQKEFATGLPIGATRVVEVQIGPVRTNKSLKQMELPMVQEKGGLWLKVKGLERCELHGSTIKMPSDFGVAYAQSLNHAYTLLSERYEKHRLAHTGNVYERIFYQDKDQLWYPLGDLRQGVLATAERKLLADAWLALEQQLGWRPMVKETKKKKGKP
jgi:hypothetical protein